MRVAALYADGKCVTGVNHGDAFSKLSEREKDICTSGFYDPATGRFDSEDCEAFYVKQLILIRHAEYETPFLTKRGLTQARNTALFLSQLDLDSYSFFASPYRRCQQTAAVIAGFVGARFETLDTLCEQGSGQTSGEFRGQAQKCLDSLPNFSVCVTHCDVAAEIVYLATGQCDEGWRIPHGSVTYLDRRKLVWVGRQIGEE